MSQGRDEDELLREVALQNAQSILAARQRIERELAQSLAMLRATLESTTDGILVADSARNITGYNRRYAEMWSVPLEVLERNDKSTRLDIVSRQTKDPAAFLARLKEIHDASPQESYDLIELKDGRIIERFSRLQVVEGASIGRVWCSRDITQQRRTENALRAARDAAERASAMKDEFLATLSHELRTPLSAILGWAHVLRRRRDMDPAELDRGLETIERNARMQTRLIEDLLDMSRITSGKVRLDIQPLSPVAFIEAAIETLRPAADAKGIRVEKVLDPGAGPVSGDPGRLQQVVWNLLANAIKFTPRGGKVQAVLERVNSHIEISIADTGIGIEPQFLDHVFERFRQEDSSSTREYAGLGLGLAIVKHLVELHGGAVRVRSAGRDAGATFTVHLPLTVVHRAAGSEERVHPRTPTPVPLDYRTADLSGVRVLVVDDEPDARDLLYRVLSDCGAQVFVAGSAPQALRLLEAEKPHVLVSDIGMPEADGFELLRRVRALGEARGGRIPAIALTAFARSEDRTRALRAGFVLHVSKPVEPAELVATVASVAGRAGG